MILYWRYTMNYLYIQIKGSSNDMLWSLLEMKINVSMYDSSIFDPNQPIEDDLQALERFLISNNFDCIISYLFMPEISEICNHYHYKYIGWVYDSPLITLYNRSVQNECNHLFIFDRAEYNRMLSWNIPHLYYLPLGTNISRTSALNISSKDERAFTCDISFIGGLYENNAYNTYIQALPEDIANELKVYLIHNLCNWSKPKPWPRVSKKTTDYMIQLFQADAWKCQDMELDQYLGLLLLSRKLAEMDRITVLNTLAEQFTVQLYTHSTTNFLQNVHIHPGVHYSTDMSKIFYLSKINLNVTLPSIESGLPQRIFDIMGSGGFVLTNYQSEIDEYFAIGKEIEVFRDLEELKDKTAYYLTHEQQRLKIAINGYQKVRDHFSYLHQMKYILQTIGEDIH